jgi:serpin B
MPRRLLHLVVAGALLVGCAAPPASSSTPSPSAPSTTAEPISPQTPDPTATPDAGNVELAMADAPRAEASPDDARAATAGINALGFDLLRLIASEQENAVISPASISIALGMARAGARGITAAEMDAVMRDIGAPESAAWLNALDQALASRSGSFKDGSGETHDLTLRIANAPFSQRGMPLEEAYLTALAEAYGAGVRLVDYRSDPDGSRRLINAWVDEQTEHRIEELLPEDSVGALTRLILVNAIYLKAPWLIPFAEEATADGVFTRADGSTVDVPMMSAAHHMAYAAGGGWQAVDLPYVGDKLSMLLILPDDPTEFTSTLDPSQLDAIVGALAPVRVELSMPKFGIETQAELKPLLSALGMPTAFDANAADFSGITTAERLHISAVIHQANIDVDEAGTEAAAATAVIAELTGGPPPETIELRFDHPFLFALRDIESGAVLFLGAVGDPSSN